MRLNKIVATLLILSITNMFLTANAITAEFSDSNFEPIIEIGNLKSIEGWEQPKTQYTPKNLRTEYQVRYNGSDANGRGAYSYTTHFTDYDTYIIKNGITQDGRYYVQDNTGKAFQTGEHVDLAPITQGLNQTKTQIQNINNNMARMRDGMYELKNGLYKLNSRMEHGLATVSALTALHPNPRSNQKLEVSFGTGMYMDNVAGAMGLFYHPNERVQLALGASYGGSDSWAGNVGVTFSIGDYKFKKKIKQNKSNKIVTKGLKKKKK